MRAKEQHVDSLFPSKRKLVEHLVKIPFVAKHHLNQWRVLFQECVNSRLSTFCIFKHFYQI